MLAVDVRKPLKDQKEPIEAVEGPWNFSAETIAQEGDIVLAFATAHCIVGVYRLIEAQEVTVEGGNKRYKFVVEDQSTRTEPHPLIGEQIPMRKGKARARVLGGKTILEIYEIEKTKTATLRAS